MAHSIDPRSTAVPKNGLLDMLEENSLVDWLSKYGKNIIYGLVALIVLFIIIYQLSSSRASKTEQAYLQAAQHFALFSKATNKTDSSAQQSLDELLKEMKAFPELQAAYGGALAQNLLNSGEFKEALPLALATLQRTQSTKLAFYHEYAKNSLLIAEQNYPEALQQTLALQKKMQELISTSPNDFEASFGVELFAFNLLRIAMLNQQLQDSSSELQAWQEWKGYAGFGERKTNFKLDPFVFRSIIQRLAIGSISLPDYIAHREKLITNDSNR